MAAFSLSLVLFIIFASINNIGSVTDVAPTRKPWPKPNCRNTGMTNGLRSVFLDTHNNFRGSLARGQTERNGRFGIAPQATIMYRMLYDCSVEMHAQQHASSCSMKAHPSILGYKSNTHVARTVRTNRTVAAQYAMATWWSELARFGMKSDMMLYSSEASRGTQNILNWSKMAWWNNILLGCAVQNCGSFYFTVCMYRPGGNYFNQRVYQTGAVCSECPRGQCDGQALCR